MPIKFVTIMDTFQKFSDLVFMRFKKLKFPEATEKELRNYSNEQIIDGEATDLAISTCENWIEKCVQTRELIPRLFIETLLIKSYLILDHTKIRK